MDFVIGHHLGEGRWEQIGRGNGTDPVVAFRHWAERNDAAPGEYGVKAVDRADWTLLVLDGRSFRHVDDVGDLGREGE
jgi:hypothetical protein